MIPGGQTPILILNTQSKRETGKKAQLTNIMASKAIADIISTTLGPRSMLKMLLDPMGGIVLSNDGHAILREIDVKHPAAKSMLEISRAQDEEVGDGTTSVIILAGEMMQAAKPFIERNIHPSIVVSAYYKELAVPIDVSTNDEELKKTLKSCIGTKFTVKWSDLVIGLALKAVKTILRGTPTQKLVMDIRRYARVEKIPGGAIEDSEVLDGVMVNKDIVHPKMRREIRNPRIMLLDCTLEYKKGESMTSSEFTKENDMNDALQEEVNEIAKMCALITKWKPDVVLTEKGVSDLAQHFLLKENISVIRRIRKTDNNRIARVSGATIVNRPEEIQESDIGKDCGLFTIQKIGDEYFSYFIECKNPKACTILLRGASKDVLNEMERNLADALAVAKNILITPKLVPGGGAVEMELSYRLNEKAKTVEGLQQIPLRAVAYALEVIPRTLAQNCGTDVVRVITELRAKHASENGLFYGIDGNTGIKDIYIFSLGKIADMRNIDVWEPLVVKQQVIKSAIEASCMLLRIDDVVSGIKKKQEKKSAPATMQGPKPEAPEGDDTFGDARDG